MKRMKKEHIKVAMDIARRYAAFIPKHSILSVDDLFSEAIIGLIDAKKKFDKKKGIPFLAYARIRIKGAVLDALRKEDILPKDVRYQVKHNEKNHHFHTSRQEYIDDVSCFPNGLDDLLIQREEAHIIKDMIERLDGESSLIIMLHYYDDLSLYDIGAIFDRSNVLMSIKIKRSLAILKKSLGEYKK
jgi:RNA polymerase sigma factor (sigma-70 family)